jgi:hypothetical protein
LTAELPFEGSKDKASQPAVWVRINNHNSQAGLLYQSKFKAIRKTGFFIKYNGTVFHFQYNRDKDHIVLDLFPGSILSFIPVSFLLIMKCYFANINFHHMKKITTVFLFMIIVFAAISQNIKRITGLKDAWGVEINYTGEIKNGKPDGYGVAVYLTGNPLRYAGSFSNGMYSGKGTLFFKDGALLSGTWKNGKLNGKGININSNKSVYIGDFINGEKNGKGVFVNNESSIYFGTYLNDKMHGRILGVWNSGNIMSDAEYRDGKRNGVGYQYEAKSKKLFEGEWKDDKWVQAATPGFSSLLKSSSLVSQMSDDRIVIGKTNSNNKLIDSSYYYDLKQKKKYLGYYENGSLRSGVIVRDDSTVFFGNLNEKGAIGYGHFYKIGKSYSEGNYVNDYMNGEVVDIDLAKKSVYYGAAVEGYFTGKARFFNESGTQFIGDYKSGQFTGTGSKIETNGRYTSGT